MPTKNLINPQMLAECFSYNPETGILSWRERPRDHFPSDSALHTWNTKFSGQQAGTLRSNGYIQVRIFGRSTRAHRVAWILINGEIPDGMQIDHINGDRADNRMENLRLATNSENQCNARIRSNNTSGIKGVSWSNRDRRWRANIAFNGMQTSLGYFASRDEAEAAVRAARAPLHREFSNQG